MSPFSDCALETGVKGIAGEEGQDVGKAGEPWVRTIVVDHRLESRDAANGFSGTSSGNSQSSTQSLVVGEGTSILHVVHIIVVNQAQIRRACSVGGMCDGEAICFH